MAANVRPYATAAAAAGYEVLAADIFGDVETCEVSKDSIVLPYEHGSFTENGIQQKLIPGLQEFSPDYLVFGSGFEPNPGLLKDMGQYVKVLGNSADAISRCKNPFAFYAACRQLDIPTPEVRDALAGHEKHEWLTRQVGGSGGVHIRPADKARSGDYYQRICGGVPVSLLFLATPGGDVCPVGFHKQILAPSVVLPYRFGGLVSHLQLDQRIETEILAAAQAITAKFGLIGLNSMDCLIDGKTWWLLEVNPRLSASLGLYDAAPQFMQRHIQACLGKFESMTSCLEYVGGQAVANLVCYSQIDMFIPEGFAWPEWVMDIPLPGAHISRDTPLCTVVGRAENGLQAELQAQERMLQLREHIEQLQ